VKFANKQKNNENYVFVDVDKYIKLDWNLKAP